MDSKYRELPSDIKLATFKEIFSLISHAIKRGYIDPFGVVTGISKNNAYLMKYEVSHPVFLSYFRNTLMDFDDMYTIWTLLIPKLIYGFRLDSYIAHFRISFLHVQNVCEMASGK